MKQQIRIFLTMEEKKKKIDLSNRQSQNKNKVKPAKVVNYNINAANCNVLSMMQYALFA